MEQAVLSKADEKLSDIPPRDYVANLINYKKSEFLRKQLIDETDIAFIELSNVLAGINNNFDSVNDIDLIKAKYYLSCAKMSIAELLDKVSEETEL